MAAYNVSTAEIISAIARTQKVTNALAKAVVQLSQGDVPVARDTLEEVAELAKEAEWALASIAYNAGLIDRG